VSEAADDAQLLAAWREGDARRGDELVRRHFKSVYRFFRGKIDGDVDDLVQQTFLACVEGQRRFRGEGSFRAFVLGIARFKFLNYLRKKRGPAVDVEALDRGELSVFELTGSPSRVAARREEQRILAAALRRLPLDLQIAVELFYFEEMSTEDIGLVLEVPRGTVKTRLMRGRKRLAELIEEVAGSPAKAEATVSDIARWATDLRGLLGPGLAVGGEQD
jgi:RNA polymerase sigma-70 factor (ECF subfamily)